MPVIHKPGSIFAIYADSPPPSTQTTQGQSRRPTSPSTSRNNISRPAVALGRKALGSKPTGQSTSTPTASGSTSKMLGLKSSAPSSSAMPSTKPTSSSAFAIPSKKRKTASELTSKSSSVDKENAPAPAQSSSSSTFGKSILGEKTKSTLGLKPSLPISSKLSTPSSTSGTTSTARPALGPSSTSGNSTNKSNAAVALSAPPAPVMGSDEWYFTKPTLRKAKPTSGGGSSMNALAAQTKPDGPIASGFKSGGSEHTRVGGLGYNQKENVPPVGEVVTLAPALPISASMNTSSTSQSRQPLRSTHAPSQTQAPAYAEQPQRQSTFQTAFPISNSSTNTNNTSNTHTRSDSELAIAAAGWGMAPSASLPMRMISGSSSGGSRGSRDVMQTPLKGIGRASASAGSSGFDSGFGRLSAGGRDKGAELTGLGIGGLSLGLGMEVGLGAGSGSGAGGMWAEGVSIGDMSGELEDGDREELLIDDDESVEVESEQLSEDVSPITTKVELHSGWTETEQGVWTAPPPPLTARQVQALGAHNGGGRMRRR